MASLLLLDTILVSPGIIIVGILAKCMPVRGPMLRATVVHAQGAEKLEKVSPANGMPPAFSTDSAIGSGLKQKEDGAPNSDAAKTDNGADALEKPVQPLGGGQKLGCFGDSPSRCIIS